MKCRSIIAGIEIDEIVQLNVGVLLCGESIIGVGWPDLYNQARIAMPRGDIINIKQIEEKMRNTSSIRGSEGRNSMYV